MRAYIHMPVEVLGMTCWATSNGGALLNLPNWVGLVDSFQSTDVAAVLLLLLRTRERGSYGSGSGPLERSAIVDSLLSDRARGVRELDAGIFFRIALDTERWKWWIYEGLHVSNSIAVLVSQRRVMTSERYTQKKKKEKKKKKRKWKKRKEKKRTGTTITPVNPQQPDYKYSRHLKSGVEKINAGEKCLEIRHE